MKIKNERKKVLVTGGCGFIGKYLVAYLKRNSALQVLTLDISPQADFQVDLTKFSVVNLALKKIQTDVVYHLAGFARAAGERDLIFQVNVKATVNLLKALTGLKKPIKVLLASSGLVYGNTNQGKGPDALRGRDPDTPGGSSGVKGKVSEGVGVSEEQKPKPIGDYAESKLAMEKEAQKYLKNSNLKIVISRAFNQIGPGQAKGFVVADVASQIAEIEKEKAKPLIRVGNLKPKRDFVDVRDAVKAYPLILEKGENGEAYNICSGKAYSIEEILKRLLKLTKIKIKIAIDPSKRTSPLKINVGDPAKIKKLGWQPKIPLEKTLEDTLNWWRIRV